MDWAWWAKDVGERELERFGAQAFRVPKGWGNTGIVSRRRNQFGETLGRLVAMNAVASFGIHAADG